MKGRLFQKKEDATKRVMYGRLSFQWLLLGLVVFVLQKFLHSCPDFVVGAYRRTFFQAIRFVLDHTFGLLPFSAMYVLVPL
ncbi:MAG: hypothetical protein AAF840_10480, partial [Bacteroidota bacterium]